MGPFQPPTGREKKVVGYWRKKSPYFTDGGYEWVEILVDKKQS